MYKRFEYITLPEAENWRGRCRVTWQWRRRFAGNAIFTYNRVALSGNHLLLGRGGFSRTRVLWQAPSLQNRRILFIYDNDASNFWAIKAVGRARLSFRKDWRCWMFCNGGCALIINTNSCLTFKFFWHHSSGGGYVWTCCSSGSNWRSCSGNAFS